MGIEGSGNVTSMVALVLHTLLAYRSKGLSLEDSRELSGSQAVSRAKSLGRAYHLCKAHTISTLSRHAIFPYLTRKVRSRLGLEANPSTSISDQMCCIRSPFHVNFDSLHLMAPGGNTNFNLAFENSLPGMAINTWLPLQIELLEIREGYRDM